jgi:hypothetical protein
LWPVNREEDHQYKFFAVILSAVKTLVSVVAVVFALALLVVILTPSVAKDLLSTNAAKSCQPLRT